jgi:alpha-D-ribose 1-methylphosphonate 5-phosphate C-P lyase
VLTDDRGTRMFLCSDTDYCETRRAGGRQAGGSAPPPSSQETLRA